MEGGTGEGKCRLASEECVGQGLEKWSQGWGGLGSPSLLRILVQCEPGVGLKAWRQCMEDSRGAASV